MEIDNSKQVSKMRRMRSYKTTGPLDTGYPQDEMNSNLREGKSMSANNEPWKRSPLKPDAPEFVPSTANDGSAEHPLQYGKGSKRKRGGSSRQASSVLRQSSNEVILAYPKKARKRKGSKRWPVLRRERTESEPIGMGLNADVYQQ